MSTLIAPDLLEEFDAVVVEEAGVDRHAVFTRCRHEAPVFFSEPLDAFVVARFDDIRAVLMDEEHYVPLTEGPGAPMFGRSFLHWHGREHNKKTGIVARRIRSPKAFSEGVDELTQDISRRLAEGLPFGQQVDLREDYAMWLPFLVVAELTDIADAPKFRKLYHAIVGGGMQSILNPEAREKAAKARVELESFLWPILEERRVNPGDDLVSVLVNSTYEGEPLPNEEVISMVVFLLAAAIETTERAITSAFRHLALEPADWDHLKASLGDRDAVTSFAAEVLRVYPPVNGGLRSVIADAEIEGVAIPKGSRLCILIASANRDETHFDEPHRFDATRFAANPGRQFTAASDILPFGAGTHHCVGSRLAQTELVHGLVEVMSRVDRIELVGEPPASVGLLLHSPPELQAVLHPA